MIDRYRKLVELSPDPVIVHQGGIIRYASPAALRVAGVHEQSDLLGRAILDFVHPSSLEDTLERISALVEPGMVSEPTEAVLVKEDGSPTVVESISVRIDWEGEPAFQVILRDVTERRRAEAATRYQASLVSHVSDAIIATDQTGHIRSWNPAAELLYGVRTPDAIGRPTAELLGPQAVEADGLARAGEVDHQHADGRHIPVLVSVAPGPRRDRRADRHRRGVHRPHRAARASSRRGPLQRRRRGPRRGGAGRRPRRHRRVGEQLGPGDARRGAERRRRAGDGRSSSAAR